MYASLAVVSCKEKAPFYASYFFCLTTHKLFMFRILIHSMSQLFTVFAQFFLA